ncbi:D-alanyl-D-alanine carboxypeptidase family protein [Piscinibacter sp.]|jgi:D-alanyl-D-alanine carboxypeptidase (penicillin-binding protein 5/6)|uniref:D-alanyl-D-alanine carboxypeptidase family protein n=1 Tax=Piscinibacter sp. TaxID=1903157 RepID=UPI001D43C125|nr:D-alanyl-D-alanine carboxypeptidase family protein [Piscinibacter sp.]MBK7531268.1 D-alanyl-D-alanine carboxypeptidase [Piscinibacter sp.]HOY37007.1 D-alanyl-D-alanine carboxypeptidase family protein [Piscinibacter sp.]
MKRLNAWLAALALALPLTVRAQAPQPPEIAAKSYLLLDVTSNQVLAERNADAPADPASLTKLMTAYVVFSAIRDKKISEDQILPVSLRAWEERKGGGSLMFIEPRSTPTVSDLLRGMIVNSGNDASVALAEGVGGTLPTFIEMMNRQAQAFGLKNTVFKNVTGLTEPGHHSSARDLAVIASRIIKDFPDFYPIYSTRKYRFEGAPASNENNRNVLLQRDPTVDGMKTGYTEAAGYCLIASAQRDFPNGKRRLISVVLNTTSMDARANESQKLLNWGYAAWDAVRLFEPGKAIATPQVWKGKLNEAKLGVEAGVFVTVPKGEGSKLVTKIERTDPLVAPLAKGQKVGVLKVATPAGLAVAEVPLVVLEAVDEAGIFGRAWDAIRLWIK